MKTKSLKFETSKEINGETIKVSIGLSDEHKNGHQDFTITGEIYETGRRNTTGSMGCIHDEILKHFPEFAIFVDLHLCDLDGVPMYAVENGFYHLENGFNNTKPDAENFHAEFCLYYRISTKQFEVLAKTKNKIQFAQKIQELGILKQWKGDATKGIALLENLTGLIFERASEKSNFHAPTAEQIADEEKKQKEGFYSDEAAALRKKAKDEHFISEMEKEVADEIKKLETNLIIKKRIFALGGKHFLNNCIIYSHSKEIGINWRSFGEGLSEKEIVRLKNELALPEGFKFTQKN